MWELLTERPVLGGPRVLLFALLASGAAHGLLVAAALVLRHPEPPKLRRVVPVEAITLTQGLPGPSGGGNPGEMATANKKSPTVSPPPPKPILKKKAKPRPKKLKPSQAEVPPPPSLALPRPATTPSDRVTALAPGRASADSGPNPGADQGRGRGTGSGPGGGAGPGKGRGQGSGGSLLGAYLNKVRALLERHKDYPRMARRLYLEGVVVLQFTIGSSGQVEDGRVSRSSGHDVLDQAAQKTLQRTGRFPPLPRELNKQQLTIEIPLAYRLE